MVPLIESFLMNTFIDSSLVDIGPVGLEKDHTTRVIITMMEAGKQQITYHNNFGTVELKIYKTFFYVEVHASPWYRCSTLYHQLYQFVVFRLCSVFQITISLCDSISFLEPTHHHKLDQ